MAQYYIGIDIGSASSKVVIINEKKEIVSRSVVQTGTGSQGPKIAMEEALKGAGIELSDAENIVATGYGRNNCEYTEKQYSEISCHAKGIAHLIPGARTIIDIGGQDAKGIRLDDNGLVDQFFMNDKCAAGTGRFLEVMSRVLEVPLTELEDWDARAKRIASVSSTCTVFAESEVISLLSSGTPKEEIIAGIHQSVATRASNLAARAGIRDIVVMSGGVAQNSGVVRAIEREIGTKVHVAPDPQVIGALGAAIYAYNTRKKK